MSRRKKRLGVARRLAAIVAVDIVGFSRLMAVDEDGTWAALNELRAIIDPILESEDGRIVKSTGDGVLVEAPSVIGAVKAAIEVQETVEVWNRDRPADRALRLRIGINLGDIIVADDGDVFGDGVNVASRLEGLADPGGICLSDSAYQQVRGRIEARFVDRGEQWVKNIPTPVQVWAIIPGQAGEGPTDLGVPGLQHAEVVGRGGHATVYRAYQRAMDRWVAVKVLDGSDETTRRRFDRERQVMGRLSQHPAVVTIYESGYTTGGRPYLIMPFLGVGSLQDRLDQSGAMPWEEAATIVRDVADAVDHAHRMEVIHRDLKPSNIMLDDDGRPLIADFGIARMTGRSVTVTERALLTPAFSPPELLDGAEPSPSGDIYGLAATFCALVTGNPPFVTGTPDTDTLLALTRRIADDPPPDLSAWSVPETAQRAVEAAMAKDPASRPATARGFAHLLSGRSRAPGGVVVSHTDSNPTLRVSRPLLLAAGIGIAAIAIGGAVTGLLGERTDGTEATTSTAIPSVTTVDTSVVAVEPAEVDGAAWVLEREHGIADIAANHGGECTPGLSCPTIAAVLLENGTVEAVDVTDGSPVWTVPIDIGLTMPADSFAQFAGATDLHVEGDHIYFVRAGTRLVYSSDLTDGSQEWRSLAPFDSATGGPQLAPYQNHLFVGFGLGFARIDEEGQVVWARPSATNLILTDVSASGALVAIIDGRSVYRIDSDTGTEVWEVGQPTIATPTWVLAQEVEVSSGSGRDFDRRVFVATDTGELVRLSGDEGVVQWRAQISVPPGSPPDERTFVAGVDGEAVALRTATGEIDWVNRDVRVDRPLVASGGFVYAIDGTELITLNARSGTEISRRAIPALPTTGPIVVGEFVIIGIGPRLVGFRTG